MQIHVLVIHICYKFREILFQGYLVMAQFVDFQSIQGQNTCTGVILTKLGVHQAIIIICDKGVVVD